jgi:hypothetical protein
MDGGVAQTGQSVYSLHMDKDALKKLKKEFEKKSKEVLKDIDALAKHQKNGDTDNAELTRRRIRKGAADATALLRQVGTLLPSTSNARNSTPSR